MSTLHNSRNGRKQKCRPRRPRRVARQPNDPIEFDEPRIARRALAAQAVGHPRAAREASSNGHGVDAAAPARKRVQVQELTDESLDVDLGNKDVDLDSLLDLDDGARIAALQRLARSMQPRLLAAGKEHPNLFDAVLALAVASDKCNVAVLERAKLACLEAAVLLYPVSLDLACGRIAKELRAAGIDGLRSDSLLKQAKEVARAINHPSVDTTPDLVREVLDDAPVDCDAVVPPGWNVSKDGVLCVGNESPFSIPAPIVIVARGVDVRTAREFLRVAWPRDGIWRDYTLDRGAAADARKLVEFAGIGLPVTSNSAKALVEYLAAFEAANLQILPVERVTSKLGFQGDDGHDGFLWGRQLLTGGGQQQEVSRIVFRGADEGDEQIADGLRAKGTMEGWLKAVKPLGKYRRAVLALYAALAAVLLRVLRTRNFIIDFAGQTTGGKTTCLRVAASAWGCPDESQESAFMATWDSTRVFRERAPAVLNNLPFIVDDTKRAQYPKDIVQTVYDIAQGRGRARGTVDGLARSATWSTIMLSSGEQPLTSFSQDGGTRPRVLELWGSPFGATDAGTGKVVRQITSGVQRNFGHAGPRFVEFVLGRRDEWPEWRKRFRRFNQAYIERAGDHAFAGRMGEHFGALHLAAELVHEALDLPWGFTDPIEPLWDDLTREAAGADRAAAALQHVYSWASANFQQFIGRNSSDRWSPPAKGWAGVWYATGDVNPAAKRTAWHVLAFYPHQVDAVLREGGFEPDPTIRTWFDRGWLKTSKEGGGTRRSRYKMKVDGESVWMVAIKYEAVESLQA